MTNFCIWSYFLIAILSITTFVTLLYEVGIRYYKVDWKNHKKGSFLHNEFNECYK